MTPLLSIEGLSKRFGGVHAIEGLSCEISPGEIVAVIGPRGAGKTTLIDLIAGVLRPDAGTITFAGKRIDRARPHEIAQRGISRTFQNVRPFPVLTVEENVIIGALGNASGLGDALERAHQPIWRLDLFERLNRPASSLSLSERRRLELARALAMRPNLLLLDEILAGLRSAEVSQVLASLRELNRTTGAAIMLAERALRAAAALASRVVVLHHGIAIADGTPEEVTRDPAVIESRLDAEAL